VKIKQLSEILVECLKRLEYAQERDPEQAGIYYYHEAVEAVRDTLGDEVANRYDYRKRRRK
jgi:hypothetical protein